MLRGEARHGNKVRGGNMQCGNMQRTNLRPVLARGNSAQGFLRAGSCQRVLEVGPLAARVEEARSSCQFSRLAAHMRFHAYTRQGLADVNVMQRDRGNDVNFSGKD